MPHRTSIASNEILDLLSGLVERSLVAFDEDTGRYSMLETVRQYSRERLMDDENVPELRARHLQAMADMIAAIKPPTSPEEYSEMAVLLDADLENIRLALEQALETGQERLAASMLLHVPEYWFRVGSFEEPIAIYRRVLEPFAEAEIDVELAQALLMLGYLQTFQKLTDEAEATLNRALESWQRLGDPPRVADCYRLLGNVAMYRFDVPTAEQFYLKALAVLPETDPDPKVLNNLALVAIDRQEWAKARELLDLALAKADGTSVKMSAQNNVVIVAVAQREFDEAKRVLDWLLKAHESAMTVYGLLNTFERAGEYLAAVGTYPEAAMMLGKSQWMRQDLRLPLSPYEKRGVEAAIETIKESLGEDEFLLLFEKGKSLDLPRSIDVVRGAISAQG